MPDAPVPFVVDIVDPYGRPVDGAFVAAVACPGFLRVGPARYQAWPGSCEVRALRQDGALFARSVPATVALVPGVDAYIQLELRLERTAGIGVRFVHTAAGMRVASVVPDGAASDAGLEAGDLIVSIDGESIRGLSTDAMIDAMTGSEGTDVRFTIQFESEDGPMTEAVDVTRRFVASP